jgi:hypothetical protein
MLSVMTAGHQLIHLSPAHEIVPWEVWQKRQITHGTHTQNLVVRKMIWGGIQFYFTLMFCLVWLPVLSHILSEFGES